jgi:peptide chain release factor subunit 1
MAQVATRLGPLVRSLAGFRAERGLAISLFLNLDPKVVPTAKDVSTRVTSVIDNARRRVDEITPELDHEQTVAARDDLDGALTFLEEELDRSGALGFALYLAGPDGVRHELPLSTGVEDAAHVGRTFAVVPLLDALERDREVVVAAVGRERATLWRRRDDRTELLGDRTEEIHGRHDQGGWSQARFQRSIEHDALAHFRDAADLLAHAVEPGSGAFVVVACIEEQRSTFEELLAPHVREALLGWTAVEAHAGPEALEPEVDRLLAARLEQERAALLDRWREARGDGGRATASWEDALEAAADAAIEEALVDGRSPQAWACPECGRGSLEAGACPLDGKRLFEEPGGALELVVRGALANAGRARRVERLDETEGVAALLRYPVRTST